MRVLLRLRHAQLRETGTGNDLAQEVRHRLRREHRAHQGRQFVAVPRQPRGGGDPDGARALEAVEFRVQQGGEDLAHAVGAEIEAEHAVAVAHALIIADDAGDDELVGHLAPVRVVDQARGVGEGRALALGDGEVGLGDAVPAAVAVHGVVAARDGGDADLLGQTRLEAMNVLTGGTRRRVAAVQERMDDAGNAGDRERAGECHAVILMRVDTAGRDEADQMACAAALAQRRDQLREFGQILEAALGDRAADSRQVLHDDAAGADVHVADL